MSSSALELVSEHACFGGVQRYYQHASSVIGLSMRFSVFLPPQAQQGAVPAVMYLAGLTCNEETYMATGGAQRVAAELGLEVQLLPHRFEAACAKADQPLTPRRHAGYDHGYYFISTFMEDHLRHHARGLGLIA